MSDSYQINQFDEVVLYQDGRQSNDTRTRRDATELELQQQSKIAELEERIETLWGVACRERDEAEAKLDLFRRATCANCGAGPSTPGTTPEGERDELQ